MLNMDLDLSLNQGILRPLKILHHMVLLVDLQRVQKAILLIDSFFHLFLFSNNKDINFLH